MLDIHKERGQIFNFTASFLLPLHSINTENQTCKLHLSELFTKGLLIFTPGYVLFIMKNNEPQRNAKGLENKIE